MTLALCALWYRFKESIIVYKLTRRLSILREHRTGVTAAMLAQDSHAGDLSLHINILEPRDMNNQLTEHITTVYNTKTAIP